MISSNSVEWLGTCVGMNADDLQEFDDSAEQISYRKFRKIVGPEVIKELNSEFTVKISSDWHVKFELGMFCGAPAVCMHHSSIHHIWRIISNSHPYSFRHTVYDEPGEGDGYTIQKGYAPFAFTEDRENAILICNALNGLTSRRRPNTKIVQS